MPIFDFNYLLFAIPGLLLSLWASFKTKGTFKKYSTVGSQYGYTGAEAARKLLTLEGVQGVRIEEVGGFLSDHYDPTTKTLRLSPDVYHSNSLSAIGVACHEAGHAIQHSIGYTWLQFRSKMVPVTSFSSTFSYLVIMGGFLMSNQSLILAGAVLFSAAVVFSLVTLPVEYDASARAKRKMVQAGIVTQSESAVAGKVLDAAFLTYVASAVTAVLTLLYYLWRAGLFGGNRND